MYLDTNGKVISSKSTIGNMAIGVPGTVAGVFEAQKCFGKLNISTILQPVIYLAKNGFVITEKQEKRFAKYDSIYRLINNKQILFHKYLKAGDTVKNIPFSNVLERLAKNGKDEFYKGETAKSLIDFIQSNGGIISLEDLEKYEPKWRKPITFQYDDLNITSMSPPSSGGICLNQIMTMIEPYDLKRYKHNTLKTIQVLVEAEKRAYADRSYYLGGPDFVDIPIKTLTSSAYLLERMRDFSFRTPTSIDTISHGKITGYESEETTHYSIVDQYGNL